MQKQEHQCARATLRAPTLCACRMQAGSRCCFRFTRIARFLECKKLRRVAGRRGALLETLATPTHATLGASAPISPRAAPVTVLLKHLQ